MAGREGASGLIQLLAGEHHRMYRIAYSWCCDAALAADLSQEAMLRALKQVDQLREVDKFKVWLYAILHNCFLGHLRAQHPNEPFEELVLAHEGILERADSAEVVTERNEIIQQVRDAVCRLPLGARQVITLVDLNECSYAEVAVILDVPIGTVMSRVHRARQALRALITAQSVSGGLRPQLRLVTQDR